MYWGEVLVAAAAVIFSVYRYTQSRDRELAWKRTEFLCAQLQHLDTNPELVEAVKILEGRADVTIPEIFGARTRLADATKNNYKQEMDKLLNLLWRQSYAYLETRAITQKEVEGFGWYFWRVSLFSSLRDYCRDNGYGKINQTIEQLEYVKDMRQRYPEWRTIETSETKLPGREPAAQRLNEYRPAQLDKITHRIAEEGIDVEVLYSHRDRQLILIVDDLEKGLALSKAWKQNIRLEL